MRTLITLLFLVFATTLWAQKGDTPAQMAGCWTDSREEQVDENKVFRPCDYTAFPNSRFRFKMTLHPNREAEWLQLSPNDAHRLVGGTWMFEEDSKELLLYDELGQEAKRFQVVDLQEKLLKLKKE